MAVRRLTGSPELLGGKVLRNAFLESWIEGTLTLPIRFQPDAGPLTEEETALIPESACVKNLGALKLEVCM
eukprot:1685168-Heterocapsa_arctica.AAC.1